VLPAHAWSPQEKDVLARAAARAPRRWLDDGWTLEFGRSEVVLREPLDELRWLSDRTGRARLIACGGVLAHLEVAIRALGWVPEPVITAAVPAPDRIARVQASRRAPASRPTRDRYRAVFGHPACRGAAAGRGDAARELLREIAFPAGVRVVTLPAGREQSLPQVGGLLRQLYLCDELRGGGRFSFLVTTAGEARYELVRAGLVAQYLRLGAITRGLRGFVLTEPFAPPRVRRGLAAARGVPGVPQLLVVARDHDTEPVQMHQRIRAVGSCPQAGSDGEDRGHACASVPAVAGTRKLR